MRLIMDSCSAILLAKASVLETLAGAFGISITKEVYQEVMKGKAKMFQDALLIERLQNENKITIVHGDKVLKKKLLRDFNMGDGEASTLAAGIRNKGFIIATDNRQGRKAAAVSNLPLVGSPEIVVILFKKGKLSYEKAITSLNLLRKEGWFDPYLIDKALEDVQ